MGIDSAIDSEVVVHTTLVCIGVEAIPHDSRICKVTFVESNYYNNGSDESREIYSFIGKELVLNLATAVDWIVGKKYVIDLALNRQYEQLTLF